MDADESRTINVKRARPCFDEIDEMSEIGDLDGITQQ